MRYWTASEAEHDTRRRGLHLVRTMPPGGWKVPAGATHAVRAETTQPDGHAVCWEPLAKLALWRNTDFESASVQTSAVADLCGLCLEFVAEDGR